MSDAQVTLGAAGELRLAGVLDYRTGPGLRKQGRALLGQSPSDPLVIDCSAVEKSSSVGLSLLLAFVRDARALGREARISGLPTDMRDIARVSGLDGILPIV
ncbi:STAS domain-containing protein [Stutzerimonas azotifigens]|uniref:STAS domain-containing protein n=1 Tax=Stutzerimonas azotifigens TaxID=291995 RepID=UPI00048409BC|nr:STAS domain-containing protein [Stutzerimonas azotifigens]